MGAEGAMSQGRVQDSEGVKSISISYNSPAGAIAAIVKHRFHITCYTEHDTCRLMLGPALTAEITLGGRTSVKKILIYDSHIQTLSKPLEDPTKPW